MALTKCHVIFWKNKVCTFAAELWKPSYKRRGESVFVVRWGDERKVTSSHGAYKDRDPKNSSWGQGLPFFVHDIQRSKGGGLLRSPPSPIHLAVTKGLSSNEFWHRGSHRLPHLPLCQRPCQLKRVLALYLLQVKVTHCLKADETPGYNYDVLKVTWWKSGWVQEYAHTSLVLCLDTNPWQPGLVWCDGLRAGLQFTVSCRDLGWLCSSGV